MSTARERRDRLAKEFCKDWPSGEVYHCNDLTMFYEEGFNAGIQDEVVKALVRELEERNFNCPSGSSVSALESYRKAIKELE